MTKKYIMIVRGIICMFRSASDEMLKSYGCYYKSPVFLWDGSHSSANAIIDKYQEEQFSHMIDWTATFIPI